MSRKLTKEEVELLKKLQEDKDLNFRGFIRQFIICNTYEPKYKVGDFVKVTDTNYCYIHGERINGLNAKVTAINWWVRDKGQEFVQYELEILDQNGKDHFACAEESIYGYYQPRHIDGPSDTNVNHFKNVKSSDSSSLTAEECGL